jgi:hypothetical protein
MRLLQAPVVEPAQFAPDDGIRAQQKLFSLGRRRTPRAGSVVLSEAEVNAFVSRHLDPTDLPLREPVIRLRDDVVEVVGTVPLGRLLHESPLAPLAAALPAGWLSRPLWLTVTARAEIAIEPRRALRLDARRLAVGRQRVPAFALRLVIDPSSLRLMRIALPPEVQTVRIERGRVVIQATSSPSRT